MVTSEFVPTLQPARQIQRLVSGAGCLFVTTADRLVQISNRAEIEIMTLLSQGSVPIESLLQTGGVKSSQLELLRAIHSLKSNGLIEESDGSPLAGSAVFWETYGQEPGNVPKILDSFPVSLSVLGDCDSHVFQEALRESGFRMVKEGFSLQLVLSSSISHPEIARINASALLSGKPWLLVCWQGSQISFGPFFIPGETACWECLRHRLVLHRFDASALPGKIIYENPALPSHPASAQLAASFTAMLLSNHLFSPDEKRLVGKLLTLDVARMEWKEHALTRRPQCPSCGDSALAKREPLPISLCRETSPVTSPGGYRSCSPEETIAKYVHHVGNVTGIIPLLKPYHQNDQVPIYNYSSGRNPALQSKSLFWAKLHSRSGNGGKGRTDAQAKVGALAEAIERYCLVYPGETYTVRARMNDLEGAIHPNHCLLFSEQQIANRAEINANTARFHTLVPVAFDPEPEIEWTPVWSLSEEKFRYLPTAFCYSQFPAADESNLFSYPDSNGCAAGNTMEEAILQGILELVERDAVAIWWYNQIPRPGMDLASAENSYINQVTDYYAGIGRSLNVLDLTTDLGIPVFAAISHVMNPDQPDKVLFAFGAHVDARIALERAMIELNQLLPITESNSGKYLTDDPEFINWLNQARVEKLPYLKPETSGKKAIQDFPLPAAPTIYDGILHCMDAIKRAGLETLVLDLTQPDVQMPVARVIVPGLRHMWQRLGPGRLYDVPVSMGWLDRPRSENELNPVGIFI